MHNIIFYIYKHVLYIWKKKTFFHDVSSQGIALCPQTLAFALSRKKHKYK